MSSTLNGFEVLRIGKVALGCHWSGATWYGQSFRDGLHGPDLKAGIDGMLFAMHICGLAGLTLRPNH